MTASRSSSTTPAKPLPLKKLPEKLRRLAARR
ncbi:hypothetical protein, partial [Sinorhizobium meliloti]